MGLGGLFLLAAISLAWGSYHALRPDGSADLLRRVQEVALFVQGLDPYDDPDMTYPPTALPVFTPLIAPFGTRAVQVVWLGLNLAALGIVCATVLRLWGRAWPFWLKAAFCLTVAASKPVRLGIGMGQFHLLPLALMLGAIALLHARRPIVAGVLIGIALVKPTMGLPLLALLMVRREWRALMAFVGFHALALLGVSAWLNATPWRLIRKWLHVAKDQQAAGLIDVPSLLERVWPGASQGASLIALVLLAATFALVYAFRRARDLSLVSLCLFVAAIFTYHRPYDLVLLLPALVLAIDVAGTTSFKTAAAVLFALLLIVPSEPAERIGLGDWYEWGFIAASYAWLGWTIWLVAEDAARDGVSDPQ